MKRLILSAAVLFLAVGPVWADARSGWEAFLARDYSKALAQLQPLAQQGDADAQYGLGVMYAHGMGVPQSEEKAAALYRRAAEQGHVLAQFNLGFLLYQGYFTESEKAVQDYDDAATWLRVAAHQGIPMAQALLGEMYLLGRGVPHDDSLAFHWLSQAAEKGIAKAQFLTAGMYALGQGTPPDPAEAYFWLSIVAERGYPGAAHNQELVARDLTPRRIAELDARVKAWKGK